MNETLSRSIRHINSATPFEIVLLTMGLVTSKGELLRPTEDLHMLRLKLL